MTNLEDLIWLYKMALQFNLEDEKKWLKQEIEERMHKDTNQNNVEFAALVSPLESSKAAA